MPANRAVGGKSAFPNFAMFDALLDKWFYYRRKSILSTVSAKQLLNRLFRRQATFGAGICGLLTGGSL
jgi:hypothetical protein